MKTMRPMDNRRGFSLFLIILIFAGIAAITTSALVFSSKVKGIALERETIRRLTVVADAAAKYYRGREDLPGAPGVAGDVPVEHQNLNIEQKYRQDAWGQTVQYYRAPTGTSWVNSVSVNRKRVAGYVLSFGMNQRNESPFNAATRAILTGGDDILIPLNVQSQAVEITSEELDVLSRKMCAYMKAHGVWADWNSDPDAFLALYGLSEKFKDDPWDHQYLWETNHFLSFGPDGNQATANDNIYGPTMTPAACSPPGPSSLLNNALYAAANLSVGSGGTVTGPVGSGGGGTLTISNYIAGGVQTSQSVTIAAGAWVTRDVVTCGNVTVNGFVSGDIHSLGDVSVSGTGFVVGTIYASGDVSVNGTVQGDIHSGGDVQITAAGYVGGTVTASGAVTGTTNIGPPPPMPPQVPADVCSPVMPPLASFTPGATDVSVPNNASYSLSPGTYRDLDTGNGSTLTLSNAAGGVYVFNSIDINGDYVRFDFSHGTGDITIFVAGNVSLPSSLHVQVSLTGVIYSSIHVASNYLLAARVYLETHGSFGGGSNTDWFGTVYAQTGISFAARPYLVGAYVSAANLSLGANSTVVYVPSNYAATHW